MGRRRVAPFPILRPWLPLRLVETAQALCYDYRALLPNSQTILTRRNPAKEPSAWMG
jgi:hypothetical protein